MKMRRRLASAPLPLHGKKAGGSRLRNELHSSLLNGLGNSPTGLSGLPRFDECEDDCEGKTKA